jgi:hypothetical protein
MIVLETVYKLGGYDESKEDNNVCHRVVAYQTDEGGWVIHDEETDTTREPTYEEYIFIAQNEVK